LLNPFLIGEGCASPIGCSNFAAERTFMFGSCNQFFNPGNKCSIFSFRSCASKACGAGGLGDYNTCNYGSYLNR
jgi:hypothetical protein